MSRELSRTSDRVAARECLHVSASSADMRYTGRVSNAFVQSMALNFEQALRLMEAALTDCPDELWQADLWPDEAPTGPGPHGGLHGSAPWFLAYHGLSCLDYDLTGEFEPGAPPQPFDDNTYSFPNPMFTKPELLGYVDWCRGRVRLITRPCRDRRGPARSRRAQPMSVCGPRQKRMVADGLPWPARSWRRAGPVEFADASSVPRRYPAARG